MRTFKCKPASFSYGRFCPWAQRATRKWHKSGKAFVLENHIKLSLKDQIALINKAVSKNTYSEIRSKYETIPTAQVRYMEQYPSECLERQEIYNLPFKVVLDTKSS